KCTNILVWLSFLKKNKPFYTNIEIDHVMLQTFSKDGSVFERLYAMHNVNLSVKNTINLNNNYDPSDVFDMLNNDTIYTFIPNPVSKETKEVSTYNKINSLMNSDNIIPWPTIDNIPINEFKDIGYITSAFPILFSIGKTDLYSV
ncbi:10191_t:CDS:1, partial [Cetraspora pellucida]